MTNDEIDILTTWQLPDKAYRQSGLDFKSLPDATPENMLIYMDKINELIMVVNELKANFKYRETQFVIDNKTI